MMKLVLKQFYQFLGTVLGSTFSVLGEYFFRLGGVLFPSWGVLFLQNR